MQTPLHPQKTKVLPTILLFLIPTCMLILGYFIYPYPLAPAQQPISSIPLFLGLILLGIGFLLKQQKTASILKILGWTLFSFFWAMIPSFLYFIEDGDVFNAAVCIIGIYVLMYMAYQEWLSIKQANHPSCLNWIAGATFIAGIIYFTIDSGIYPPLKENLIEIVAYQSTLLMNLFGLQATNVGEYIAYNDVSITIIFACTAVQSMVLFVGMIGALPKISWKQRILGLIVTVIPIYVLNLVRNAGVIYLVGSDITSFNVAHNIIAKAGALLVLIALLFVAFKLIPSLFDELSCIMSLPKRNGPIEQLIGGLRRKPR